MRAPRRPLRLVLAAVLAALAFAAEVHGDAPRPLPGPAPRARVAGFDPAAENRACEACHEDIAREWRGSLHHGAWDDPVFQTAYAIEPIAFCRGCHAPEADPAHVPGEGARRLGVGCVTCHVEAGEITGVRGRAAGAVHAVRGDARLATQAACEPCHQFEFPAPQRAPMQGTADEHRASRHAGESCQRCHMAPVAGSNGKPHRSHDFRVLGDSEKLRSAVTARAARDGDRAVTVSLSAARIGHAFPTGDMFRRLEVRARAVGEHGEDGEAARPAVLARRFTMVHGPQSAARMEIGDDRVPASGEAREVRLSFGEAVTARAVRWEVAYQRLEPGMAVMFGVDPAADEVIVARGVLPPEKARR